MKKRKLPENGLLGLLLAMLIILSRPGVATAQELLCQVRVNAQQIQNTNAQLFRDMQEDILRFMNNTNWTKRDYKQEELIECNLLITINSQESSNEFSATVQINAARPVYGSTYTSPIINFVDQAVTFQYDPFQPLEFSQGRYANELSSLLSFYAYIIIGLDADTFEEFGGTPFLNTAEQVANAASNSRYQGWKSSDGTKTRYWLITYLLDPRFKPLRECMYQYHRRGLDLMIDDVRKGREAIEKALYKLEPIHERIPNSYLQQIFFDTKHQEIGNIFSQAETATKNDMLEFLQKVDLNHFTDYQKAIK